MFDDAISWHGRPAGVWSLVLLDLAAACLCAYGTLAPATPASPTRLNAMAATLAVLLAAALWIARSRAPRGLVHTNLALFVGATTTLVASAATGEGALSAGVSFLLVVIYAAVFLARSTMRTYLVLVNVGLVVALSANEVVVATVAAWMPMALGCTVTAELLAWLMTQMRALAVRDPLTGLPNRAGFEQALRRERGTAARTGGPLALAVIDLDAFKAVNDRHGHAAGDDLLMAVTQQWTSALRHRDVVARRGGDEFAMLFPATAADVAEALLDRLRRDAVTPWSYGVTIVGAGEDADSALARADEAMYLAKRQDVQRIRHLPAPVAT